MGHYVELTFNVYFLIERKLISRWQWKCLRYNSLNIILLGPSDQQFSNYYKCFLNNKCDFVSWHLGSSPQMLHVHSTILTHSEWIVIPIVNCDQNNILKYNVKCCSVSQASLNLSNWLVPIQGISRSEPGLPLYQDGGWRVFWSPLNFFCEMLLFLVGWKMPGLCLRINFQNLTLNFKLFSPCFSK